MLFLLMCVCVLASSAAHPCGASDTELRLVLTKNLLRSLENQEGLPNPSVHVALRLSECHALAAESRHLAALKDSFHNHIQSSLPSSPSVLGLLALYTLALRSSCHDLTVITFTVAESSESLLTLLKKQLEVEKEHIAFSGRPLTNYYQYCVGVLALCVSNVRVNNHVSNKLIRAVTQQHLKHGDTESIDTYAMAGMALQCVKDSGSHVHGAADLDSALGIVKAKLLAGRRDDGHIGNEFSTGLAVQALLAMGGDVSSCSPSMDAMRTAALNNTYTNPMAASQVLPPLHHKSYLAVKDKDCRNEDNTLDLEPLSPGGAGPSDPHVSVGAGPSDPRVSVGVEVVMSSGSSHLYSVDVPTGSFLLDALRSLQEKNVGFTFQVESSLWGPFLSAVNGEQARQNDRRYWDLSSDGTALSQGVGDYKVEATQKITLRNTSY